MAARISGLIFSALLLIACGCTLAQETRHEDEREQARLERLRQECLHCNPGGPCDTASIQALGLRAVCGGGMGP
jgi:hypothetical protein